MKYVSIKGERLKLTKKYIKTVLQLPHSLSHYQQYSKCKIAIAIQYLTVYSEDTIADTVDRAYSGFDQLIKEYEADQQYCG
jgi:hypothetical protein